MCVFEFNEFFGTKVYFCNLYSKLEVCAQEHKGWKKKVFILLLCNKEKNDFLLKTILRADVNGLPHGQTEDPLRVFSGYLTLQNSL